jgi:Tol biopolymer transport system component
VPGLATGTREKLRTLGLAAAGALAAVLLAGVVADRGSAAPTAHAAAVSGRIAFVRAELPNGRDDIWTMRPNGQDQRPLALNDPDDTDRDPAYSPNGKWLAFISDRGDPNDGDLYIARAHGTHVTPLRVDEGPQSLYASEPEWSPDSRRIVFVENDMGGGEDVMIINRKGGKVRPLAHTDEHEYAPSFSPNGRWIIYTYEPSSGGSSDLHLIKPNGAADHPVIATGDEEFLGRFMPDGRRIVFGWETEPLEAGERQIWIAKANGQDAHVIVNSPERDERPSPLNDGTDRIVFESNRDTGVAPAELYIAKADGQGQTRLTFNSDSFSNTEPAPAPKASCGGRKATIIGTSRPDKLIGGPLSDVIAGFGGKDTIKGLGKGDVLCGGGGRDRIIGGAGPDRIFGGPGLDLIRPGPGRDQVHA